MQTGGLSKYLLHVFICRNGEAVSLLGRCNNATDCFDNSDEENCIDTTGRCALIDLTFHNGDEERYKDYNMTTFISHPETFTSARDSRYSRRLKG